MFMNSIPSMFETLFGHGTDLAPGQMAARAVAIFLVALVVIRISGRRSLAQHGPFDVCVTVLLGAVLSRAVVGASPFWGVVAAAAVFALLHRTIALASIRWNWVEDLVNGHVIVLMRNGCIDEHALHDALVTHEDLERAMREQIGGTDLKQVRRALLEKNGHITILKRH
jgi:uncharacterized membrane protein YcaP (DUF421 family)